MVTFVSMVVTYSIKMIKTLALASNFLRLYFTVDPNMLECFSLENLTSLVLCLRLRPEEPTHVELGLINIQQLSSRANVINNLQS